jgi:hypothetical protein
MSRATRVTVLPEGEPLYSEKATHIEVVDEAGGEFIEISQSETGKIRIDPEEWLSIRPVIDQVFSSIEEYSQRVHG